MKENAVRYGQQSFGQMSIRDYFAAQALPTVLAETKSLEAPGDSYFMYVAKLSYRMADAMLEIR